MASQLRRAAAAAREALVDVAAGKWAVERATLAVEDAAVVHAATGRRAGLGELTRGQKLLKTVSEGTPTTPAEAWRVAGQSRRKVNGRDIVTGRHKYTSDLTQPGMASGLPGSGRRWPPWIRGRRRRWPASPWYATASSSA
jgi:CO/xanthine dehydrogenase Mo-binding subunit